MRTNICIKRDVEVDDDAQIHRLLHRPHHCLAADRRNHNGVGLLGDRSFDRVYLTLEISLVLHPNGLHIEIAPLGSMIFDAFQHILEKGTCERFHHQVVVCPHWVARFKSNALWAGVRRLALRVKRVRVAPPAI